NCLCYVFFFLLVLGLVCFFFFFSSRRRHTRYIGDWSSDVCSSDLLRKRRSHLQEESRRGPAAPGALLWRRLHYPISGPRLLLGVIFYRHPSIGHTIPHAPCKFFRYSRRVVL